MAYKRNEVILDEGVTLQYVDGACVSMRDLERLAASETSEEETDAIAWHLQECEQCAAFAAEWQENKV